MGDVWYKSNIIYEYMTCFGFRSHSCSNSPVDSLVFSFGCHTYYCSLSIVLWFFIFCRFALNFWNHHLNTDRQFQWWPCTFQEGHQKKGENWKGLQDAEGDMTPWVLKTCFNLNRKGKRIHFTYNQLQLYTWWRTVGWIMVVSADLTSSLEIVRQPPYL